MIRRFFVALFVLTSALQLSHAQNIDLAETPEIPEVFAPGLISTGMYERDIAISPDGNEIIFTLGDYRQLHRCLVSVRRTEAGWGERKILPFSGTYHDIEPFISPGGTYLYFASTRPMPGTSDRTDYNIWTCEKVNGEWSNPIPLDAMINTEGDEFYPSVTRAGHLYFTAVREDGVGKEDIFISRLVGGVYQKPVALDSSINTETFEFNAFVSPDEDVLIFSSYGRPDDLGGGDLYISRKQTNGSWGKSENMGESVNSPKLDFCPFVDFERGNFYFTSERTDQSTITFENIDEFVRIANQPGNGLGDIYRVRYAQIMKR